MASSISREGFETPFIQQEIESVPYLAIRAYRCPEPNCGVTYTGRSSLPRHIKKAHPELVTSLKRRGKSSRLYSCRFSGCDATFVQQRRLNEHLNASHPEWKENNSEVKILLQFSLGEFPCPVADCDASYTKRKNLETHVRMKHGTSVSKAAKIYQASIPQAEKQ